MISRRTLDLVFAGGGVLLALLLLAFGYLLADQGSFARSYVRDQLGQQKITFTAADKLTPEDTSWKPGSSCLVTYAGQLMETGKQAECYANYFIGMHLVTRAEAAGYPGATYATLGTTQSELRSELATAKEKGDTDGAAKIQEELDAATSLRSTMQTGETLRGLLLTSYGFSIFGEKAVLASNIVFIAAALMAVLSVAGFVHAFLTPREKMVFSPLGERRTMAEPTAGG